MQEIKERKIMYHIIMALEHDLIDYLYPLISIEDFDKEMMNQITQRNPKTHSIKEMLEQLDLGNYITILNRSRKKLEITQNEFEFINNNFNDGIVKIRNRVMHPKSLMFNDYVLLRNLFDHVDQYIHSIPWLNVINARDELNNNLEKVLEKDIIEFKKDLIDNLPELNCEEIDFIGRGKEIGELRKLLLNDKIRMISVVAAGGYGKTALVLKVLNEFKSKRISPFDLIIWVSFKTRQLDKTSFIDINNAIVDTPTMNRALVGWIGSNENNIQQELIELAKQFNMLLVLDNFESINQQEIFPFIEEFYNYGKILITSRVSLGELDKRYDLQPLINNDAMEIANKLLEHYHLDDQFTYQQIQRLTEKILFSNPLSIKWAIRSIANGSTLNDIITGRENVVSFCMSNVYNKISPLGKNILSLLSFNNNSMTKGQIIFYLQKNVNDIVEINSAITELSRACFLDKAKMKEGYYDLIEQGKIFMETLNTKEGLKEFFVNKKREVNAIHQEIDVSSEQYPYNNDSITIFSNTEDMIISAYYLHKAVKLIQEKKNSEALELINLAENISPNYSECYKIHGLLLSYMEKPEAKDKYLQAIKVSQSNRELLIQQVAIANYYIRTNMYPEALKYIEEAQTIDPNNIFVTLENVKILIYTGKYNEAEKKLNNIDKNKIILPKEHNIFITRKADLMRRKAELLDEQSQKKQRLDTLYTAFNSLIMEKEPDDSMNSMLCRLASDLAFLPNFKECAKDVLTKIIERLPDLLSLPSYNEFKRKLRTRLFDLDHGLVKMCLDKIYGFNEPLLSGNMGQIISIHENYGFIINKKFPGGIYFYNYGNFKEGDVVTFTTIKKYDKLRAVNVSLLNNNR